MEMPNMEEEPAWWSITLGPDNTVTDHSSNVQVVEIDGRQFFVTQGWHVVQEVIAVPFQLEQGGDANG